MSELLNREYLEGLGYTNVREIPDQGFCGLQPMLFTVALFCHMGETGYKYRYCYPDMLSARAAIEEWDGEGDPPGPWIKKKP